MYKWMVLISLLLTGCQSIGPGLLKMDRYNYNLAVDYSSRQEMLLNIVRLRYNEGPMILKVGNISGSAKLDKGASLLGLQNFQGALSLFKNQIQEAASINYSDNPIISYTPMDNKEYITHFLRALSLEDIKWLLESSWSITRVFRLVLQEVGTSPNATSAARATSSHAPEYRRFSDMLSVLRRIQIQDGFVISYKKQAGIEILTFHLKPGVKITKREQEFLNKAGVEIYQRQIVFSTQPKRHQVYFLTRSVLGILNYLSKGVNVPEEHHDRHVITTTYRHNGERFDWGRVLKGMIIIYVDKKRPTDAAIAIPYRNLWYYIKDSDPNSKETLVLLQNVIGLIASVPIGSENSVGLARIV